MMDGTLEPLSRKEGAVPVRFSLRGSLAARLYELKQAGDEEEVSAYLALLLASKDSAVIKFIEDGLCVIGLRYEIGQFPPDW